MTTTRKKKSPVVSIIMGSESDWPVMKDAASALKSMQIPFEVEVVSAHRTPNRMVDFGEGAADRGIKVIIAGAGGAAHLPGMVASTTTLPVVGVPVKLSSLDGMDSLLSIAQMPKGVPVATMAIDNAYNAGLFAARILGLSDTKLATRLSSFKKKQVQKVNEMNRRIKVKNR